MKLYAKIFLIFNIRISDIIPFSTKLTSFFIPFVIDIGIKRKYNISKKYIFEELYVKKKSISKVVGMEEHA